MRSRSKEASRATNEALVHDGNLQKVLGKRASFKIIVVSFTDSAQEAHGPRPAQLKLEHAQHEPFGFEDLIDRVASIDHINDLLHRWAIDLLVFSSNENSSRAYKLQFSK
jgi:hypothetical protein